MWKLMKYSGMLAMSLVLVGGLAACGMFGPEKPETEDEILLGQSGRTMWESGIQYVKIVNRDVAGVVNQHPASLTKDDLKTVLSSLYVSDTVLFNKEESQLFAYSELQILATALSSGLNQAQPNEDVNFVSIGLHESTLAKERKSTTGRVFISDGRLNIIFGLVRKQFTDLDQYTGQKIDRRIHTLDPGTRKSDSKPALHISLDKGQTYYTDPKTGKERSDWLVIDIATVLATAKERDANSVGAGSVSPELLEDIANSKQEVKNLRHDVSSMKEIMFDMNDEIDRLKQEIEILSVE